jgi:CRP-like cAMP-binding protein
VARKVGEILSGVPLFAGLSKRHLRKIGELAEEVPFDEGAHIATEDEPGDTFYVIVEGEAKVIRGGRTVARLLPGDFFGEVSLLDGGPRTASVVAETPLLTFALTRAPFRQMLEREPSVVLKILHELAIRLRHSERLLTA